MSDLGEKVHNKVVVTEAALEGVDTLWSKHPKKIVLAIIVFLIYLGWQIRYEILDYTHEVQRMKDYQQYEDSIYHLEQVHIDSVYAEDEIAKDYPEKITEDYQQEITEETIQTEDTNQYYEDGTN